jgi:hypothetical protein
MTLFGLLSLQPIDSPLTVFFPVQPTPAERFNCTAGPDASYLLFAPSSSNALRAVGAAMSALGEDAALCPVGYPSTVAMHEALRTDAALRATTSAAVEVAAPNASTAWSYEVLLPANISKALQLDAQQPAHVRAFASGRGQSLNSTTNAYATSGVLRLGAHRSPAIFARPCSAHGRHCATRSGRGSVGARPRHGRGIRAWSPLKDALVWW